MYDSDDESGNANQSSTSPPVDKVKASTVSPSPRLYDSGDASPIPSQLLLQPSDSHPTNVVAATCAASMSDLLYDSEDDPAIPSHSESPNIVAANSNSPRSYLQAQLSGFSRNELINDDTDTDDNDKRRLYKQYIEVIA